MASSTEEKVKQIIVEQLGVDESEVTPTASFIDDLGADSLDTVELVMALEEGFGIEIPDEDAEKITTVKDAITYIEAHLPKVLVSIEVVIWRRDELLSLVSVSLPRWEPEQRKPGRDSVKAGAASVRSAGSTRAFIPRASPQKSKTSIL